MDASCKYCQVELKPGENWTPGLIKVKRKVCRVCFASIQKEHNAKARAKPENQGKAYAATKKWREDNPAKYAEQLEKARAK